MQKMVTEKKKKNQRIYANNKILYIMTVVLNYNNI